MNKKIWIAALLVTVMAVAAGCGSKPTAAPNQTQGAGTENNVTEVEGETITEPVTAEPEENTTPTESTEGSSEEETTTTPPSETSTEKPATSESNEKKTITVFYTDEEELELHKASAEISYASDDAKYKATFESLQQSKDAKLVPLWSKEIELKSVQFKDGALTLDIHMPDTARLGAGGESYALDALKQTFFQFDEIKSLDLLVDGQQTESLMGHVDLEHPMTRSE
ncbi:GerMN domain-containing protein [Paenibacillus sp. FSL M7-0656]|uniref:GerMN domain-containing protein n=1 Tax=Paenibacillus sp. FSL M7-0656 TaxID=2921534 RepID=UPI0030F891A6